MAEGQGVLERSLDMAALERVGDRLQAHEATRGQAHARQLRDVLEVHRIHRLAGLELNTVPYVSLMLGCSEHRAHQLHQDALLLLPLPGALEAVEVGLLTVEQSRRLVDVLEPVPFAQRLDVWRRLRARLTASDAPLPPARLSELLRGWIIQTDSASATERRKAAEAAGSVDFHRRADGLNDVLLLGLNGPDAQGCLQSIRRHADSWGSDDDRTADKRHLDAARDLLLGRMTLGFGDGVHCRPGCDCKPLQPAPCGADITVHCTLGAGLGTTDEPAELVGHGPIEPDLLQDLLMAGPTLREVFVDEHGVPVADSPRVEHPARNDPAAVREALLRLAASPPGPRQPRHPDDHPPGPRAPDRPPPDDSPPDENPPDDTLTTAAPLSPGRSPRLADMTVLERLARATRNVAAAAAAPGHVHPAGAPGAYRVPARMARFLRARRPRCEWPGCGAAAIRCDLDHDLAWPQGPTCPCNLGPLCRRHHRVKQTGWDKQRTSDGGVRWTSPNGKTWTSPTPHQPPQPALRPLPPLPTSSELDELSPLALTDELWHLDPGNPTWHDPAAHELRAEETEPDDTDDGFPTDTHWTHDLDDPYAWLDLLEPAYA